MQQGLSFWADVATALLALEALVLLAVPGACLYFAVRGARWLLRNGRPFFRRAQGWAEQAREKTDRTAAAVAAPVVTARTLPAWVRGVWRGLKGVD